MNNLFSLRNMFFKNTVFKIGLGLLGFVTLTVLSVTNSFAESLAIDYQPVVYVTSDVNESRQINQGETLGLEVFINSLGNQVKTVELELVIEGAIDHNVFSFGLHPRHVSPVQVGEGFEISQSGPIGLDTEFLSVIVVFEATDDKGFNEGSAVVPLYLANVLVTGSREEVRAYISRLKITTVDGQERQVNYTPKENPYRVNVIREITATAQPVPSAFPNPTPRVSPDIEPVPSAAPSPIPEPSYVPEPRDYEAEFEQLRAEIDALQAKVDEQQQEVSRLRRLLDEIMAFFGRFF